MSEGEAETEAVVYRSPPLRLEAPLLNDAITTLMLSMEGMPAFLRVELPGFARDSLRSGDRLRITVTRADGDS